LTAIPSIAIFGIPFLKGKLPSILVKEPLAIPLIVQTSSSVEYVKYYVQKRRLELREEILLGMDRWMTNLFKDKSGVLANSGIKIDPGLFESYWIMVILIFFISPFQIMVDFWIIINHKPFHFFSTILFFFIILCYS